MAEWFLVILAVVALIAVGSVLVVLAVALGVLACATLWALVKPWIGGLIDAWVDWFERRTGC